MPRPAERRLLPPSALPATPRSSRTRAQDRLPLARRVLLPVSSDNAPPDSRVCSDPGNSARLPQTPPQPPPVSSSPALQTTPEYTCPADTPPPFGSIRIKPVAALPPAGSAIDPPSRCHAPPSLPAVPENIRGNARSSTVQTAPSHTPLTLLSSSPLLSATASARTSTLHAAPIAVPSAPLPPVRTCLPPHSAKQTSPETADCAPDSAPVSRSPPPAQTECPDSAALPAPVPSPVPVSPLLSATPIHPPATSAYSRRTRSVPRSPLVPGSPLAFRLPLLPVLTTVPAALPTPPATS